MSSRTGAVLSTATASVDAERQALVPECKVLRDTSIVALTAFNVEVGQVILLPSLALKRRETLF
jgi:hypothetical protein